MAELERSLDRLYERRFDPAERAAKAALWGAILDGFLHRYVPAGGTVLDVGAGSCELINRVHAARRIAVDLNPDVARHAAPGVETHLLPIERLADAVAAASVDTVFASNVFEHLPDPDALLRALAAVHAALKVGGRLVVIQPNVARVGGRFWDFFDHTLPLTDKGMAEALEVAGFAVEERRARFLPYTTKSRWPTAPWLVRLYLALPPAQWLFGEQMLVVARR